MTSPYLSSPKYWTKTTLSPNPDEDYILSVTSGSTPSTSIEEYWDGDIPWLTPKDITNASGIFVTKTERTISAEGLQNSGTKLMLPGTVMLTKRAPVGIAMINAVPITTNQGFLNFRCGKLIDPTYLCFWLRCNKPYLEAVANGSTYPELYVSDLFEFEISIPPLDEQEKISKFLLSLESGIRLGSILETLSSNSNEIIKIRRESEDLVTFRDLLLPKLLSGEISVEKLQVINSY